MKKREKNIKAKRYVSEDHCGGGGGVCVKTEELRQLLHDKVLAGVNGGHLSSDCVYILTQGNTVLLRLIPICVKPCGERMNLVCEGLSRTRGDLRVVVLRVAYTGCGCW